MATPPVHQDEPRYGWAMVGIAAMFQAVANGGLGAITVFLKPLATEFGWLRGETSFAYLVATIASGLGGILMGYLADRYPTRIIVMVGALLGGLFYLGMSQQSALWQFYLLNILFGGLCAATFFVPLLANVGAWFSRRRGLALGLTTAGQALGQGIVPYVTALFIVAYGWRGAYIGLAVIILGVLFPLSFLVRNAPGSAATRRASEKKTPGSTAGDAPEAALLLKPAHSISLLSMAGFCCCVCMAVPLIHAVPLASDKGLGGEQAARVVLIMLVVGFFGRISFGRLADRIGGLYTYMIASFWQTALVFFFTRVEAPWAFYVLAGVYGFGYAGVMTGLIISVQQYSPKSMTGLATGIVTLFAWIGMGTGAYQGGLFFDLTGGYAVPFAVAVYAGIVNLWLLGVIWIYEYRRRGELLPEVAPA